jgi:hypothetical protein
VDEGSHTRSYYFGPSIVIVNCIHEMIDNVYFAECMGCEPGRRLFWNPMLMKQWCLKSFLPVA